MCVYKNQALMKKTAFSNNKKYVMRYIFTQIFKIHRAGIYLLNRNTRKSCEICSKLRIKIPERRHGVVLASFVNFEHVIAG